MEQVSPSTFMWIPGIDSRLSDFRSMHFDLLNHLVTPHQVNFLAAVTHITRSNLNRKGLLWFAFLKGIQGAGDLV